MRKDFMAVRESGELAVVTPVSIVSPFVLSRPVGWAALGKRHCKVGVCLARLGAYDVGGRPPYGVGSPQGGGGACGERISGGRCGAAPRWVLASTSP